MDYTKYRFEAQVDWIEIQVSLSRSSNTPNVRRVLESIKPRRRYYVEGDLNSGTMFSFKIQDPRSFAEVESIVDRLSENVPVVDRSVLDIEIVLDAYARPGTTHADLAALTGHFFTFAAHHAHRQSRMYREHTQPVPTTKRNLIPAILDGCNLARGEHRDKNTQAQRAYFKRTDGRDGAGKPLPLPEIKYRARTEITLRGTHCPVRSFDDLKAFDFKHRDVAKWFNFRTVRDDLTGVAAVITAQCDAAPLYAIKSVRRPDGKGWRDGSPWSCADTSLNRIASRELADLSRRWAEPMSQKNGRILGGHISTPPENSTISESPSEAQAQQTRETGKKALITSIAPLSPAKVSPSLPEEDKLSTLPLPEEVNLSPVNLTEATSTLPGDTVHSTHPSERSEPGSLDSDMNAALALLDDLSFDFSTTDDVPATARDVIADSMPVSEANRVHSAIDTFGPDASLTFLRTETEAKEILDGIHGIKRGPVEFISSRSEEVDSETFDLLLELAEFLKDELTPENKAS